MPNEMPKDLAAFRGLMEEAIQCVQHDIDCNYFHPLADVECSCGCDSMKTTLLALSTATPEQLLGIVGTVEAQSQSVYWYEGFDMQVRTEQTGSFLVTPHPEETR